MSFLIQLNREDSDGHGSLTFQNWLSTKEYEGYYIPNLNFALRNTKEIIEYDRMYKPEYNPFCLNHIKRELEDKNILPTELWPLSGTLAPSNQTHGLMPKVISQDACKSLYQLFQECFESFPSSCRVAIISTFEIEENILDALKDVIERVRGCKPLSAFSHFPFR